MMHQLLIDHQYCRGLQLCHQCEAVRPGLVKHCEQHGRLLISWPATAANAATKKGELPAVVEVQVTHNAATDPDDWTWYVGDVVLKKGNIE